MYVDEYFIYLNVFGVLELFSSTTGLEENDAVPGVPAGPGAHPRECNHLNTR